MNIVSKGEEIGVVLSGVKPLQLKVLLFDDYIRRGEPVWNSLIVIDYEDGFCIGKIIDFQAVNSLMENPSKVKNFLVYEKNQILRVIKQEKEALICDVFLISAFDNKTGKRLNLNKVVKIGSKVYRPSEEFLSSFLKNDFFFYLGKYYGENMLASLYIRDFQDLGEAYHFVVSGQTGSGKSTTVMLLMCLYALASYRSVKKGRDKGLMNFLVISPVPEFTNAFLGNPTAYGINMKEIFESMGYEIKVYTANDLAFDTWEILKELLEDSKIFREVLNIRAKENIDLAISAFVEGLKKLFDIDNFGKLSQENFKQAVDTILDNDFIERVYKDVNAKKTLEKAIEERKDEFVEKFWDKIHEYFNFNQRKSIKKLIWHYTSSINEGMAGKIVVIETKYRGESSELTMILLREIIRHLRLAGEEFYKKNPEINLNTLVVFDEAHNYVPKHVEEKNEKLANLKDTIVKAYAETRKFGIGWYAVSTRLSLLDRHIYEHARVKIIGYGLTTGTDRDILREDFGSEILNLYFSIADPTDPLNPEREHTFLIAGPVTVLSRKDPELITIFSKPEEFLWFNNFPTNVLL